MFKINILYFVLKFRVDLQTYCVITIGVSESKNKDIDDLKQQNGFIFCGHSFSQSYHS